MDGVVQGDIRVSEIIDVTSDTLTTLLSAYPEDKRIVREAEFFPYQGKVECVCCVPPRQGEGNVPEEVFHRTMSQATYVLMGLLVASGHEISTYLTPEHFAECRGNLRFRTRGIDRMKFRKEIRLGEEFKMTAELKDFRRKDGLGVISVYFTGPVEGEKRYIAPLPGKSPSSS